MINKKKKKYPIIVDNWKKCLNSSEFCLRIVNLFFRGSLVLLLLCMRFFFKHWYGMIKVIAVREIIHKSIKKYHWKMSSEALNLEVVKSCECVSKN